MHVGELFTPGGKRMRRGGVRAVKKSAGSMSFEQANEIGSDAIKQIKQSCDKECMKKQVEAAHKQMGLDVGKGKSDKLMLRVILRVLVLQMDAFPVVPYRLRVLVRGLSRKVVLE